MRIGVCCMKQFPLNWNAMRKWEWENELEKNTKRKNALLSQGFTSTNIYFSTWFRAHVHIHILMFTIRTQKQMPLAPPPSSSTTTIVTVAAALTLIFMEIPTQLWLLHHNQHVFVSQWFSMLFSLLFFSSAFVHSRPTNKRVSERRSLEFTNDFCRWQTLFEYECWCFVVLCNDLCFHICECFSI